MIRLQRLSNITNGAGLRAQLVRGGIGSVGIKIARIGLGFLLAVVLARGLGPDGYGLYSYVFSLVSLLAIPAQLGLPTLVLRETASAHQAREWAALKGLWRWANTATALFSLALILFGGLVSWLLAEQLSEVQRATFMWGLGLVPLIALGSLRSASLLGLNRVITGQLPESVLRPGLLILFFLLLMKFGTQGTHDASYAMGLHCLAASIAFVTGAVFLRRARPTDVVQVVKPTYKHRAWTVSTLPLALIAGMQIINQQTDIVMLGLFTNAERVGIYRVAAQGATFVSFGLTAVGMMAMPYFARFHAAGDMLRFQRLATTSARAMLALALPVALILIVAGEPLLRIVFGDPYGRGYFVLAILAVANVVHAAFGIVGPLLNMTGHERITAKGISVACFCNIVLNLVLIPPFGLEGAASATAITLIIWNLVLWNSVRSTLGIDSSFLNRFGLNSSRNRAN